MKCFVVLAVLFSGVITAGSSDAAIRPYALSLSPFAGGYVFEGNQRLDDRPIYGLAVGYNFSDRLGAEVVGSYVESNVTSGEEDNVDLYALRLDLLYHFRPKEHFVPYVAAGVGGLSVHPGGESDEDGLFNYGVGFKYFVSDNVAFRADVRHILDIVVDDSEGRSQDVFNNLSYTAGLTFQFGGPEKDLHPKKTEGDLLPKDTDGDGVIDTFDRCPGTKLGVPVDGFGCPLDADRDGVYDFNDSCPETPAGVEVDRRGCPPDSDGDGVYDHLDQCPGTPAGTAVDDKGCPAEAPMDSDGDGVENDRDKCPNTPPSIPVNAYGCPEDTDRDGVFDIDDRCPDTPEGASVGVDGCPLPPAPASMTLQLEFDSGKAAIRPEFATQLRAAAAYIKVHPGSRILIEGYTDSVGSAASNRKLSQQRAESVRDYLIENHAIAPERLEAKGFGEEHPIADNATPEGRQQNRRVTITAVTEP
jgi:OOP family OmpA-OmpF porin